VADDIAPVAAFLGGVGSDLDDKGGLDQGDLEG
jgi:hypothetical protein